MRQHLATLALIAAAAGLVTAPLEARPRPSGEEKLAKMLEGRTAGEPRNCIATMAANNLMVIDRTALVYRSGRTLWVNRTANPRDIDDDDILIIKRFSGSSLCRQDQITLADRATGGFSGVLLLGDFVPYQKTS